jgi:hypothetical protein
MIEYRDGIADGFDRRDVQPQTIIDLYKAIQRLARIMKFAQTN